MFGVSVGFQGRVRWTGRRGFKGVLDVSREGWRGNQGTQRGAKIFALFFVQPPPTPLRSCFSISLLPFRIPPPPKLLTLSFFPVVASPVFFFSSFPSFLIPIDLDAFFFLFTTESGRTHRSRPHPTEQKTPFLRLHPDINVTYRCR